VDFVEEPEEEEREEAREDNEDVNEEEDEEPLPDPDPDPDPEPDEDSEPEPEDPEAEEEEEPVRGQEPAPEVALLLAMSSSYLAFAVSNNSLDFSRCCCILRYNCSFSFMAADSSCDALSCALFSWFRAIVERLCAWFSSTASSVLRALTRFLNATLAVARSVSSLDNWVGSHATFRALMAPFMVWN